MFKGPKKSNIKPASDKPADSITRRQCLAHMALLGAAVPHSFPARATEQNKPVRQAEPLEFGFVKNPPGEMFTLGSHRLHSWSVGSKSESDLTVLFEPGLGGSSLEWLPLAESVSNELQAVLYDRAGYGWSDPGLNPRHVVKLAREIKLLIGLRGITGKLILVGHSYGGLIMRELTRIAPDRIRGLVLVDASHEDQFVRLNQHNGVSMLPTSDHFVISSPELPDGLRDDVRKKILAFSRMRKTYAALHAEIASFRDSCDYIRQQDHKLQVPLIILSRGQNPADHTPDSANMEKIWQQMQVDFLQLSDQSQRLIAHDSGHHIHIDQPALVYDAIMAIANG